MSKVKFLCMKGLSLGLFCAVNRISACACLISDANRFPLNACSQEFLRTKKSMKTCDIMLYPCYRGATKCGS